MEVLYAIQSQLNKEEFFDIIQKKIEEDGGYERLVSFNSGGASLVHWASISEQNCYLSILLDKKLFGDINTRDESGASCLHWASGEGKLDCISLLLDKNADVHLSDNLGETPIHWAALNGHEQVKKKD